MSKDNGVLRINRKGRKKFAFGEEGAPFEVDVVSTFQEWIEIDDTFRSEDEKREIADMAAYHAAAIEFVRRTSGDPQLEITTAEALDFLARLREVYEDLADFFHPRSREERGLPSSSGEASTDTSPKTELRFSMETP